MEVWHKHNFSIYLYGCFSEKGDKDALLNPYHGDQRRKSDSDQLLLVKGRSLNEVHQRLMEFAEAAAEKRAANTSNVKTEKQNGTMRNVAERSQNTDADLPTKNKIVNNANKNINKGKRVSIT